jgi:hypothetical protein
LVADALVRFGQNLEGEKVLLISPSQLAELRKDENYINGSDISTEMLMKGTVGMIHGCQIALSDKIASSGGVFNNFIVKPGALAIFLKRDVNVETDRNITRKLTITTADKHYVAYLYDESKAIKVRTLDAAATLGALTVSSAVGATSGKSAITVTEEPAAGDSFVYKTTPSAPSPVSYNMVLTSGWTAIESGGEITPTDGHTKITVAEVNGNNQAKKAGSVTLTVAE